MTFTDFMDRVFFYLSVPKCIGCGEKLDVTDKALCPKCLDDYLLNKRRDCSRCARTLDLCGCSNKYLREHRIRKLVKVYRYIFTEGEVSPANNLIYSLKRDNRRDVLQFLSRELAVSIRNSIKNPEEYIFTNVPRRAASVRQYGIDHAAMLAKAVARELDAQYIPLLLSKSKKPQKHTKGEERIKNALVIPRKRTPDLKGKKIIIIDDIVTTGASMSASAKVLYKLGSKSVTGAAIAIAYKDEYVPFVRMPL